MENYSVNSSVVEARDIWKTYGELEAVQGVSFDVHPNECYGFLGPNGAGKSTVMRMIYCFVTLNSGSLRVMGHDVTKEQRKIKSLLGVVPQDNNLDPDLDVLENLLIYSRYFDIPQDVANERARQLLKFLSIDERRKENVEKLSGGMQRRLVIARSLINEPKLLILDEPTTGLDPQARHLIWQRLRELKSNGVTMILTTHYMEEAEQLCDRLSLMDAGIIVEEGTPQELIRDHAGKDVFEVRRIKPDSVLSTLKGLDFTHETAGDTVFIYSRNGQDIGKRLFNLEDADVHHRRGNLEDVFFRLTGKELKD